MTSGPSAEPMAFNGVDGASGQYLTPPLTEHDLANLAQGKPLTQPDAPVIASPADEQEARHLKELAWRHRAATEATFAPIEGVDPKNLAVGSTDSMSRSASNEPIRPMPMTTMNRNVAVTRPPTTAPRNSRSSIVLTGKGIQNKWCPRICGGTTLRSEPNQAFRRSSICS